MGRSTVVLTRRTVYSSLLRCTTLGKGEFLQRSNSGNGQKTTLARKFVLAECKIFQRMLGAPGEGTCYPRRMGTRASRRLVAGEMAEAPAQEAAPAVTVVVRLPAAS